jgi:uncharacterized protein YjiS (DUF1127 family)
MASVFYVVANYIKHRAERQRALRDLYRMTDRELSDIGIGRCDIERLV